MSRSPVGTGIWSGVLRSGDAQETAAAAAELSSRWVTAHCGFPTSGAMCSAPSTICSLPPRRRRSRPASSICGCTPRRRLLHNTPGSPLSTGEVLRRHRRQPRAVDRQQAGCRDVSEADGADQRLPRCSRCCGSTAGEGGPGCSLPWVPRCSSSRPLARQACIRTWSLRSTHASPAMRSDPTRWWPRSRAWCWKPTRVGRV